VYIQIAIVIFDNQRQVRPMTTMRKVTLVVSLIGDQWLQYMMAIR